MAKPKITYTYKQEVKNQKNNPFCKMDRHQQLHTDLARRLGWMAQLHQSKEPLEQELWEAMTIPDKIFGRSALDHCQNTGMSALGGAVEKLAHGDLSQKQLMNIKPVLKAMNQVFPELWSPVDFQDKTQAESNSNTSALFEF